MPFSKRRDDADYDPAAQLQLVYDAISEMKAQLSAVALTASSAMNAVNAHVAVCDERQRQLEARRVEHEKTQSIRELDWNAFKTESRLDRQGIRDAIIATQNHMQRWAITILTTVVTLGLTYLIPHFLGVALR